MAAPPATGPPRRAPTSQACRSAQQPARRASSGVDDHGGPLILATAAVYPAFASMPRIDGCGSGGSRNRSHSGAVPLSRMVCMQRAYTRYLDMVGLIRAPARGPRQQMLSNA